MVGENIHVFLVVNKDKRALVLVKQVVLPTSHLSTPCFSF